MEIFRRISLPSFCHFTNFFTIFTMSDIPIKSLPNSSWKGNVKHFQIEDSQGKWHNLQTSNICYFQNSAFFHSFIVSSSSIEKSEKLFQNKAFFSIDILIIFNKAADKDYCCVCLKIQFLNFAKIFCGTFFLPTEYWRSIIFSWMENIFFLVPPETTQ